MTNEINQPFKLNPDDQQLLDALVESGFDPQVLESLSAEDRCRVGAILNLFELLEDYPVEDADDSLVHATLARIDQYESRAAAKASEEVALQSASRRGFRLPDLISVAAVFLIGASIFWPMLSTMKQRRIDDSCANNLRQMGYAFAQYANDYNGSIPVARTGLFSQWTQSFTNAVNLGPLVAGKYCERDHLECAGHEGLVGASYGYQWQIPDSDLTWGVNSITVILGDRNPLIDAIYQAKLQTPILSNSLNHGGRGQNVLRTDGQWMWLENPMVGADDNIWLPKGVSALHDGELQTDGQDIFLAQ
ncbi:MAG: hypothetical protein IH984_15300 [Planctomycetes bacterium]|nr:hypothetical protein [Planctomycetota bacterium]